MASSDGARAPRQGNPGTRPLATDKTHLDASRFSKMPVDDMARVEMAGKV
ncbi:MAG: hypothetical protein OXF88_21255 [Rhodobacteraceae bacterium]|nr:hypothetical protein [Paracoccaceae bacterium]MCY4136828.1 hypothetical protein [Paracoccaceae bacterium]